MKKDKRTRVCPVEAAGGLDNSFQKIIFSSESTKNIKTLYKSQF
jgi:hypothetical protein